MDCVTGARVVVISTGGCSGAILGRIACLGRAAPLVIDPDVDATRVKAHFEALPECDEQIVRGGRHLRRALDLILFSGHRRCSRAACTTMQASVSSEKNTAPAGLRPIEGGSPEEQLLGSVSRAAPPLTSIIGYSEMLRHRRRAERGQKDFVSTIHEKGEQLLGRSKLWIASSTAR